MKPGVKKIGLQLLIVVAVTEILFRMLNQSEVLLPVTVPDDLWNHGLRPRLQLNDAQTLPDGTLASLHTNSLGLAQPGEVVMPKPADVCRILILGDSVVQGLSADISIPTLAQQRLASVRTVDGKRLEIINGGIQSYSGLLHIARYEHQYRHLALDAVVVMPDLTDVFDDWIRYRPLTSMGADGLLRVAPSPALAARARADRILLVRQIPLQSYRRLAVRAAQSYARRTAARDVDSRERLFAHARDDLSRRTADGPEGLAFATESYATLLRALRRDGVTASVVLYPHLPQITSERDAYSDAATVRWNRSFEDSLTKVAAQIGVPVTSLFDTVAARVRAGDKLYLPNDPHFNEAGLRLVADEVASWIRRDGGRAIGANLVK